MKAWMPDLRRPILGGLELLFGWVHIELGECTPESLLVEKPSGAAEIQSFLQCHSERLPHRPGGCKWLLLNILHLGGAMKLFGKIGAKTGQKRKEPPAMQRGTYGFQPSTDHANVVASPTVIFAGVLVLGFGLDLIWPAPFLPEGWGLPLGLIVIFVAVNLKLFAAREMVRVKTNLDIRKPTTDIVTSGPFSVSRNPLYIGMTLLNIGIGCIVDSLWIFLLSAVLAVTLQKGVIEPEEAYLEKNFGDKYLRYKARVRRWI